MTLYTPTPGFDALTDAMIAGRTMAQRECGYPTPSGHGKRGPEHTAAILDMAQSADGLTAGAYCQRRGITKSERVRQAFRELVAAGWLTFDGRVYRARVPSEI